MSGSAELRIVAAAIRKEGSNPQVAQDIARGLRQGRSAIRNAFKSNVLAVLPASGGLNRWVAAASFRSPVRAGGRVARMNITVSRSGIGIDDMAGLDTGQIFHPLYGQPPWSGQGVPPQSISKPILDEGGDQLEQAVLYAADGVVRRIVSA